MITSDARSFFCSLSQDPNVLTEGGAAEAVWDALVAGAWALVDSVDTDSVRVLLLGRSAGRRPRGALSPRQRQVLGRIELGQSSRFMAATLGLSEATVSESLGVGMRKLGYRSRREVVLQGRIGSVLAAPHGLRAAMLSTRDAELAVLSFGLPLARLGEILMPAESAVVTAALTGRTDAQIANARGTSRHTVGKQLASARKKLASRTQEAGGLETSVANSSAPPCLPPSLAERFAERAVARRLLP